MSATDFVHNLFDAGRVRVSSWQELPADFDDAVRVLDEAARPRLAYEPPALEPRSAVWALRLTYRAAQALIYREIDGDEVRQILAEPCPSSPAPDVCFSVDLSFCLLPDLISLARGLSEDDPLVTSLLSLAARWPLSSVGVKGLPAVDLSAFLADRSLRRLYADRVIEKSDASRLDDAAARQAVREALGAFLELAPAGILERLAL